MCQNNFAHEVVSLKLVLNIHLQDAEAYQNQKIDYCATVYHRIPCTVEHMLEKQG